MKMTGNAGIAGGIALAAAVGLARSQPPDGPIRAQAAPKPAEAAAAAPGSDPVEAIDGEFARGVAALERRKLDSLARLAAGQRGEQANSTYEALFSFAIARGLFNEAEPIAERARQAAGSSARVASLALLVDMIAEADRGEFDASLASLVAAVRAADHAKAAGEPARPGGTLPPSAQLSLLDAYYQKLVHAGRFDVARKALGAVRDQAEGAAIKDYAAGRLKHLDLIGRVAPAIAGTDVDGKPFRLADARGDVVLVVFWASWCLPCGDEVRWIDRAYDAHRAKGFRVVGINLDAAQEGGLEAAAVLPTVRRFLVEHDVRWPNLINGPGDRDHAGAYGVSEIPANFLIGRDGTIVRLDLARSNAEAAIARAVGR